MLKRILLVLATFLCGFYVYSQKIKIKGEVFDEFLVPFNGAKIKGETGFLSNTNEHGIFEVFVKGFPINLTIYADGYQSETIVVNDENQEISLILKEESKLNEIVLSASRIAERVFESPVSIRRLGTNDINNTTAKTYFEALGNLPGVSMHNNGASLQIVNTRGFSYLKNLRFIQLVDGIDNIVLASSTSYGNLNGAIELDVKNAELLPGASSALYGANAINGALIIRTKNAFEDQGITVKFTGGLKRQNEVGTNSFYGVQSRLAHKFNDYFAASASFSLDKGEEWHANDYRNVSSGVVSGDDINSSYVRNDSNTFLNGLNIYGDERIFSMKTVTYFNYLSKFSSLSPSEIADELQLIKNTPNLLVSRTGYRESDLVENRYENRKFHASLYFRPFGNDKLNVIWRSRFNTNTPYNFEGTSDRYEIDSDLNYHLLEINNNDFFVRGYYSGLRMNAKSLTVLGTKMDSYINSQNNWLTSYINNYKGNDAEARTIADAGRPIPGTPLFNSLLNKYKNTLLADGGSTITDLSKFYHFESNVNLSRFIDWNITLGGSYRIYALQSKSSLYSDTEGNDVNFNEYGAYAQVKRSFLTDKRLSVQGSLRYDGTTNFKGQFSPRISASYTIGEDKNHSFRATYQTAFRNPAIQDQYYAIQLGDSFTFGNTPDNINRLEGRTYKGLAISDYLTKPGFTKNSFDSFFQNVLSSIPNNGGDKQYISSMDANKNLLEVFSFDKPLESENLQTLELGYRGLFNIGARIFEVDLNGYYNQYSNFITNKTIFIPLSEISDVNAERIITDDLISQQPFLQTIFDVYGGNAIKLTMPVNNYEKIYSYGSVLSLKTKLFLNLDTNFSYSWTTFSDNRDTNRSKFDTNRFNTPTHTIQFGIGNKEVFKHFGFQLNYKWQSEVIWDSPFSKGIIAPQNILDAQVSYQVPSLKSRFKLGVNNILTDGYYSNLGVGQIGRTAFLSWTINN